MSSVANQRTALVIDASRFILKLDRNTAHVFYFLNITRIDLPGQLWVLHGWCSDPCPTHVLPLLLGGGSVQVRLRALVPPPQDKLHVDQWDHWVQLPSTVNSKIANHQWGYVRWKCSNSRMLEILYLVTSCYCFRARGIVPVICFLVVSKCMKLFTWFLTRAATRPVSARIYT